MLQESFLNTNHPLIIGGCALVVVILTSFIHHLVKRITWWWSPKWGSFAFSVITGSLAQSRFVQVLEPLHVLVIAINILLIFLSAVGLNALTGTPIMAMTKPEFAGSRGRTQEEEKYIFAIKENWRTRWFA